MAQPTAMRSSTAPALEIEGLSVVFDLDRPVAALSEVSLRVEAGEIVGLVGESGCGKSLTALAVMGLLPPNARRAAGHISVAGAELDDASEKQLRAKRGRSVGMVFQEPMVALNPLMRVGRQVEEVLAIHHLGTRQQRRQRALQLLRDVGLSDPAARYRQYPHQLSGGMRQRVMIAMALAGEPALLLADEPTTALDATVQAQILDLLVSIRDQRQTAILLVTHDMGVVAEVADRVAVMYAGRVVETATVSEIFHHPRHPYTAGLLASIPAHHTDPRDVDLRTIPGRVPSLGSLPAGCPFAPRCPRAQERCRSQRPPLAVIADASAAACWYPLETPSTPLPTKA